MLKKYSIYKFSKKKIKVIEKRNVLYFYLIEKNKLIIFKLNNLIIKNFSKSFTFYSFENSNNKASFFRNILKGLICFYKKILEIRGIGYKFEVIDNLLEISLGLSHNIFFKKPDAIKFIIKKNKLKIIGFDLNQVSQVAARIKLFKKIDNYKGKGVRYLGQSVILKQGKKKKR